MSSVPRYVHHWTHADNVPAIQSDGLHPSTGGLANYHENEPGVNLTTSGEDPSVWWNPDIFYIPKPSRITVDTSKLDPRKFGPDLNSVANEDSPAWQEIDPTDPQHQTVDNSIKYTGNLRYLDRIPPQAIVDVQHFEAPRQWKLDEQSLPTNYQGSPEGRVGARWMPSDYEVQRGQFGNCLEWALAHQSAYPDLRIGMHWFGHPADCVADENVTPNHFFTHDDKYAYDTNGVHDLPYDSQDPDLLNNWADLSGTKYDMSPEKAVSYQDPQHHGLELRTPSREWIMRYAPNPNQPPDVSTPNEYIEDSDELWAERRPWNDDEPNGWSPIWFPMHEARVGMYNAARRLLDPIGEIAAQTAQEHGNDDGTDNWCGAACQQAQQLFKDHGIASNIEGRNEFDPRGWSPHSWLRLEDGSVVDPTIIQFGDRKEEPFASLTDIYHGRVPSSDIHRVGDELIGLFPADSPHQVHYSDPQEDYNYWDPEERRNQAYYGSLPTDYQDTREGRSFQHDIADIAQSGECYDVAQGVQSRWPHLKADSGYFIGHDGHPADHAWNRAEDGTIVDATASQFGHDHVISPDHALHGQYISYEHNPQEAQSIAHSLGHHEDPNAYETCPDCSKPREGRVGSNSWDEILHPLGEQAREEHWTDFDPDSMPSYVYRTMSDEHFQHSMDTGQHASDERGNYRGQYQDNPDEWDYEPEAEGTVAGRWAYPGYAINSPTGISRIVKIRVDPNDGWRRHPDDDEGGYWHTFNPIPTDRFESWTRPFAYTGNKPVLTNYQDTREGRNADPDVPSENELRQFLRDGEAEGVHDQCYEVARAAKERWPHLQYVEGRYYRAMNDGEGNPDLPGHAWLTTPSGTVIDTSHAQFNPSIGPLNIVSPNETYAYERYLPDGSPELHKILKDNGWVDYQGWPNRSNVLTDYQDTPEGRVAAETTQQLLERMPAHTNKVLTQNDEGWTVQQPQTYGDLDAMGEMMNNCWFKGNPGWEYHYEYHPDWPEHVDPTYPDSYPEEMSIHDSDGYPMLNASHPAFESMDPAVELPEKRYLTLHDPHGVPRLAYDPEPNPENDLNELLGRHNSEPKEEYLNVWNQLAPKERRFSMAADPHWLDNWIERNGPYLYHYIGSGAMENLPNLDSFQKGLLPWDHRDNPSFTTHDPAEPSLGPRPGHVYLRAKPLTGNDGVPRGEEWRNIKVDLRKLDPENLVADEDNVFMDNRDAARQWEEDQKYFEEENPHWADDPWDARAYSGGEFAEVNPHFFDGPAETAKSLESNHPTIAHRGPIPPEAMEFNYPARVAAIEQSMLSVIAAETTQQLLNRMPETTNYISQPNEDGWTIQQPRTFKDLDAMGTMMSNCWAYGTPLSQQHYMDHPHWPKGVFPSVWHLNTKQDEEGYAEAARQGLIDAEGEPVWSHSAYDLDLNQKLPDHKRYYTLHDPHNIPRLAYDRDGELLGRHNSDPKPEYLSIWNALRGP